MNKIQIPVPKEVKFISDWKEYRIPDGKCIIDKKVCGCGYTHFCITNQLDDLILCSPRVSLLENKSAQNSNCYYFRSTSLTSKEKRDLNIKTEEEEKEYIYRYQYDKLSDYIDKCASKRQRIKLLVTYDSLPKLLIILSKLISQKHLERFKVVVDEFQLIFNDAKFKAGVELDFVEYLDKYCKNVVYLSGTPMVENYLDALNSFKDLPYYELIWDNSRISQIKITRVPTKNLEKTAIELIKMYREGKGPIKVVSGVEIQSTEAVLFVNNVSMITAIIKGAKLMPEEVNIITAKTPENLRKIRKCGRGFKFGEIPILGKPHKMITICTATAFCGVDMYSLTAKAYVFSSCNLKTMTVDISLELPQIVGRQRLEENPFRKEVTIYYSDSIRNYTEEAFKREIALKSQTTFDAINGFNILRSNDTTNIDFERRRLRLWIAEMNYTEDYTSLSRDTGLPVFNELMRVSDIRSWELQNKIYNNEKEVINVLSEVGEIQEEQNVFGLLERFVSEPTFEERLSIIKEYINEHPEDIVYIPEEYVRYLDQVGTCFRKDVLDKKLNRELKISEFFSNDEIVKILRSKFLVGESYSKKEIKDYLLFLAEDYGYDIAMKANYIERVFDIAPIQITNIITKKREHCYKIISLKQ